MIVEAISPCNRVGIPMIRYCMIEVVHGTFVKNLYKQ